MGLNSRKAQVIWPVVIIALAGLILILPFVWRALKTKARNDIRLVAAFVVPQLAVWTDFALDNDGHPNSVGTMIVWICAIAAAVTAAWVYRPLNKDEQMDQAATTRPGTDFLN
jgi:glucose dehydrogenase